MRRLGVEQDTASRASCLASTRPGGFGSPPGPTTGVCHRLAGRGAGERGEIRRMRASAPAACTRKRGPDTQNRRDGAPGGVAAASALRRFGDHAAETERPRCAARRSAAPHVRGVKTKSKPRRNRARECRGVGDEQAGCLKIKLDNPPGATGSTRPFRQRAASG